MKPRTHTVCYKHSDITIMRRKIEDPMKCVSYFAQASRRWSISFDCETCYHSYAVRGRILKEVKQ